MGGLVNSVTGSGTPVPVASTGMSAYLSKLIPVDWCAPSPSVPNNSASILWFL